MRSTTDGALLMQGAVALALLGIAFLGLQLWWLSTVFLNRPRQPRSGNPTESKTLQEQQTRYNLFDRS